MLFGLFQFRSALGILFLTYSAHAVHEDCVDVLGWTDAVGKTCDWYSRSGVCKRGNVVARITWDGTGYLPELNCCVCGRAQSLSKGVCWEQGFTPWNCCTQQAKENCFVGNVPGFTFQACCDTTAILEANAYIQRSQLLKRFAAHTDRCPFSDEDERIIATSPLDGNGEWHVDLPVTWGQHSKFGHVSPGLGCRSKDVPDELHLVKLLQRMQDEGIKLAGWVVNVGAGTIYDGTYELQDIANIIAIDPRFVNSSASLTNVCDLLSKGGLACAYPPDLAHAPQKSESKLVHIDVLKVDVDGCDCSLSLAFLREVHPKLIIVEVNGGFPPPLRFQRQCHPDWSNQSARTMKFGGSLSSIPYGCSLSAAVAEFWAQGYQLSGFYNDQDAVFIDRSVAMSLGISTVDEVACYREKARMGWYVFMPRAWLNSWVLAEGDEVLLGRVWCSLQNQAFILGTDHLPFSLSL